MAQDHTYLANAVARPAPSTIKRERNQGAHIITKVGNALWSCFGNFENSF